MRILFWLFFILIAYTYAGYPFILLLLSKSMKRPVNKSPEEPSVTIILSAFNEEKWIEAKLKNLLEMDYPEDKIEILVGSDGGSDTTDQIISHVKSPRVRFFRFVSNLGKPSVLNALVTEAHGSVLVFTDARQEFDRKAIRMLVRNFNDPAVGCVSGELYFKSSYFHTVIPAACNSGVILSEAKNLKNEILRRADRPAPGQPPGTVRTSARPALDKTAPLDQAADRRSTKRRQKTPQDDKLNRDNSGRIEKGMDAYWRYEKFLRRNESEIGSMLGATGAIYAIRRELFMKLPVNILVDDMYIPLQIVSRGYRAVFESEAEAYDQPSTKSQEEFKRKVRTLAGNYQIFFLLPGLLQPGKSAVAWQLISHKLLRLLIPFFLLGLFSANLFLLKSFFYWIIFSAQLLFYGLALWEWQSERKGFGKRSIGYIPYMFCLLNYCAFFGLIRFLEGKHKAAWERAYA